MEPALQTMIENMPEKTGKSLEEWKNILKSKTFKKHSEGVNFLKTEHKVTHGFANTIVSLANQDHTSSEELVKQQYKGKEALFPIYEQLVAFVTNLGNDVTITPKKGSVSIIRKWQFLLIKPATKTRVDLGLKLKDKAVGERLENSGPFGSMCTHRVKLSSTDEIDQELKEWIREAYEKSI